MFFIGQKHILSQLGIYLPYLYENDVGMSFLVTGPSGYGKTKLCLSSCNYLTDNGDFQYAIPNSSGEIQFNYKKRVHFFDEIHTLAQPEILYPILDENKHVIFLASNETGELPEALVNRCFPLVFDAYSIDELMEISRRIYSYNVSDEFMLKIIDAGGNNPRVITKILQRLNIYTKVYGVPSDIDKVLLELFGIKDGLDVACQRYLEILDKVGGTASLDTLSAGLHINKSALKYQVEPILLFKNKIRISSKGRTLN